VEHGFKAYPSFGLVGEPSMVVEHCDVLMEDGVMEPYDAIVGDVKASFNDDYLDDNS